jgi:mannose-1-phosphate guanylyltransferase/phosphomannomutase
MKKAVIMAGGFGTRLRPLTMKIPKPMVPIYNTPMMEHIVRLLGKHGINDILSVLYFQPDVITDYFENGRDFNAKMNYVTAVADYGTAGAVKNAHEHLKERFIVISGDVLSDFDITKAIKFHEEKKSMATLLLTRVEKPLQYGIVMTDEDGKINRFLEKPSWGQVFSDTINTGIYILEPEVLDLIPYQEEFDFSQDLFPLMLEKKMPLYGYIADGYWKDVGNLDEYMLSQQDCLEGKVELILPKKKEEELNSSKIASSAELKGKNQIGKNVSVGENSVISNCIIGNNVRIGNGVRIHGSILWDNITIGDFAELNYDVICNDCKIGDEVFIGENVFMAENCIIGNTAKLNSNIKLWPNKRIEDGSTLSVSLVQEEKWQRELFTGARITGISNLEITPEFGAKLGASIGLTLNKNSTVMISRDPDPVSRITKRAIIAGLCSVGINAYDLQELPIPQSRMEMMSGKFACGIHVRHSRREKGLTDIIIFSNDGRDIPISKTKKIERFFFGEDIKRVHFEEVGKITYSERTLDLYRSHYLQALNVDDIKNRSFKILIDYSYGMASALFPSVLGQLDVQAVSLNSYIDATKYYPDPSDDYCETDQSCKIMTSLGYELGFSILPGAEKISVIDERGIWYSQTRMLTILTKLFLECHKDEKNYKIGVSIAAPKTIDTIAAEYGVEVVRLKNNHSAMMEATKDKSIKFLGGIYGGYIFPDFLIASDGMFAVGKILEMIAQTGLSISQIDDMLPKTYRKTTTVSVPWYSKGTVMRKAMEHSEFLNRQLIEGVKIILGESKGSVLIMPDQSKAAFSLIIECEEKGKVEELTQKYTDLIKKWKED